MTQSSRSRWTAPLGRRAEALLSGLLQPSDAPAVDFGRPLGEPALLPADSVSWRVFANPVSVFVGGVAAVLMELAEPRVRAGVWDHSRFRAQPLERLRRTGLAAMMSVYGPRTRAEAMIENVGRAHARVQGVTPEGRPYRALDPELLTWVHATACHGFLQAYVRWVGPLPDSERDRFYAEGLPIARRYGAPDVPASEAAMLRLLEQTAPQLRASPTIDEFLQIAQRMPMLPRGLRWLQCWLVAAAVETLPPMLRERFGLSRGPRLRAWQRWLVRALARACDGLAFDAWPPVQAARRVSRMPAP